MIKKLFIKDIKLLIKDLKFQIFFLILVILFILSAVSSSVTYHAFTNEYQELFNEHQNKANDDTAMRMIDMLTREYQISVYDKPSPAILFSVYENYPNRLKNEVVFYRPNFRKYGTTGTSATEVFRLNWYFILGILSGFIMLIMSFEAVSSEKRSGTLRLLSIYGFKRQAVLWCKYISYMLLYLIIIIPPALISLVLFFTLTGTWEITYMVQFILILLLSIPFASFFVFLGMFISMVKNYRNAIVIVVFVWLLFVIIIPQSATIFGKLISPIKTSTEYAQMERKAWIDEYIILSEQHNEKLQGNGNLYDGIRAAGVYACDEKGNMIDQKELEDYKKQLRSIEIISQLSPFAQFEKISEIIFDKGYYMLGCLMETMKNTQAQVRNMMIEQDSRDETSIHLLYSWAGGDRFAVIDQGFYPFSNQKFEQPNLLFVTDIPTDDTLNKTLKILYRLLPILLLNLLLIIGSVMKLERLDIR